MKERVLKDIERFRRFPAEFAWTASHRFRHEQDASIQKILLSNLDRLPLNCAHTIGTLVKKRWAKMRWLMQLFLCVPPPILYKLVGELSRGYFGLVYVAIELATKKTAATQNRERNELDGHMGLESLRRGFVL